MVLYLFNSMILPLDFDLYRLVSVKMQRIEVAEATALLGNRKWVSAIGHESTASFMSGILGVPIYPNRKTIFMRPGDSGLHFFLKKRLPEGTVLGLAHLEKMRYWFVMSEIASVAGKAGKETSVDAMSSSRGDETHTETSRLSKYTNAVKR